MSKTGFVEFDIAELYLLALVLTSHVAGTAVPAMPFSSCG